MYALGNIEKFVEDNKVRLGDRAQEILDRAKEVSLGGLISGGSIEEIMEDEDLAQEFHAAVMSSPDHIEIGLAAMHSAP